MNAQAALLFPDSAVDQWKVRFWQRLHERRFWAVQGLVVLATLIHMSVHIFEDAAHRSPGDLYVVAMYTVYFVPVIYASLNFGRAGAVPTAVWAGILTIPSLFIWHHGFDRIVEAFQHFTIIALAFLIAGRVDREVAARREAERENVARRISEAKYRGLFEAAGDAILVFDAAGVVQEANAAVIRLLGRPAAQICGYPVRLLLGEENADILFAEVGGDRLNNRDVHILEEDGRDHWLEPACSELRGSDGRPVIQALLRDVTLARERQRGLEVYTRQIIKAQEDERQRISRDLHDSTLQSVVLLCRELDELETTCAELRFGTRHGLSETRQLAESIASELRRFSRDLRPSILDDLGLVPAVRWLVNEAENRSAVRGRFRATGSPRRLEAEEELMLFRIAQEALTNVTRHSGARNVTVTLSYDDATVHLSIKDDGKGFAPGEDCLTPNSGERLGLLGMRERARLLGGTLDVQSRSGKGTRVYASIPIHPLS